MGRQDRSTIGLQVSERDRKYFEHRAAKKGMRLSDYLRYSALLDGFFELDPEALKIVADEGWGLAKAALERSISAGLARVVVKRGDVS